jgi:1,4-alpha-glucan branching enzyme
MRSLLVLAIVALGCTFRPGLVAPPDGDTGGSPQPTPMPPSGVAGPGGASFRIWAPHARAVTVVGDFNPSSASGTAMQAGADGIFSLDVPEARAGQRYRLRLQAADGTTVERADPRARAMDDVRGASIIVDASSYAWQSDGYVPPPPEQRVVYELHLGTFNPPNAQTVGSFRDAAAKLDYLAGLGVTLIEVMPPAEFGTTRSWGYNTAQPFAIEESYGTPDDFRAFVDGAHAHGMGVIIDVVNNHYDDSVLRCFDGDCMGADGVYFYLDARRDTPWGPRPDFGRPEVRSYLADNTRMWLEDYRADGLRWDSVLNIRQAAGADNPVGIQMLKDINDMVHQHPGALEIAEDLQNYDAVTRATKDGGLGFDSQWDAGFFHPLDDTIVNPSDQARSMYAIRDAITHNYGGHALSRVIYTEDHDEVANGRQRIPEMITPGDAGSYFARKRSTLGAAIVMTAPGTPMIFMGQEFLENGYFADTHPLDWSKTTRYAGILQLYRDLIKLRRNQGGVTTGLLGEHVDPFHVNDNAKVIAYHRWNQGGPGDDVVVVANFSNVALANYQIGLPSAGTWHVRFNSDSVTYSPDYADTPSKDVVASPVARDGQPANGSLPLGRYSVVILSQDR